MISAVATLRVNLVTTTTQLLLAVKMAVGHKAHFDHLGMVFPFCIDREELGFHCHAVLAEVVPRPIDCTLITSFSFLPSFSRKDKETRAIVKYLSAFPDGVACFVVGWGSEYVGES